MRKNWIVCCLLFVVYGSAKAGTGFIFLADTTKLFYASNNEIYSPNGKQLLYFQKGNIFFNGTTDDKQNIFLLTTSMNIASDKLELVYEKDSRDAAYSFSNNKFYLGKVESEDSGQRVLPDRTSSFILPPSSFAAALIWLFLVEFAAAGWYRAHEHNLISRSTWKVSWDRLPSGFRAIKIAEDVRQTLRFDDGREVFWQTSDPSAPELSSTDYLFFFRWNPGSSSVVRARAHRPDICLPSVGWEQIADRGAKNYVARDGTVLPVRHIAFKREGRRGVAHAFFCLQEDKVHSEEPRPDLELAQGVQPDWSMRGRTEAVKNGVRNLGQQVLEVVILSAQPLDDGMAEEKFATIVREMIQVETDKSRK